MNIYLIIFNDGAGFRIEEAWLSEISAIKRAKAKGELYQVLEYKIKDSPVLDNGLNHIREIVLDDYEIE